MTKRIALHCTVLSVIAAVAVVVAHADDKQPLRKQQPAPAVQNSPRTPTVVSPNLAPGIGVDPEVQISQLEKRIKDLESQLKATNDRLSNDETKLSNLNSAFSVHTHDFTATAYGLIDAGSVVANPSNYVLPFSSSGSGVGEVHTYTGKTSAPK